MRLRRGWPLVVLVVALIVLPITEIWLLVQLGQAIGLLPTVLLLVVEAIIGSWLLRHEGRRTWRALNDAFVSGRVPSGELADAALVLVGGVLLILPGLITDVIGLLFLLPWTRRFARRLVGFFVARQLSRRGVVALRPPGGDGVIIEGEAEEVPPSSTAEPIVLRGEIVDRRPV